ncbi:hypothetical protein HYG86_05940 [Alkalicella caledoniensis]|uniref:Uncharacterized protein n=1 Tax=Alkalicella caledoniensis TaxID=2731377 RepID=A0A7G9W6N4_ALKCA|nr:hypothetical protein [Alkalicella caledoniensis]QNO14346.1 hypothetical protein HYG86_05940 [Alkalicella caledoniensis]
MAAISNNNEFFSQRQVESIEELWKIILRIRKFSAPMSLVYGILKPDEYLGFVFSEKFDISDINESELNKLTLEIG